jgi:hypothetical protein
MDNCPDNERKKLFALEQRQYKMDPFFSYPAGGGESIAGLCLRVKTTMLSHWARECPYERVTAVCHGHVMRALQIEFENLGHDDFIRLDASEEPADKIRNGQILWYTRRDPETGILCKRLVAVRSVCPLVSPSGAQEDHGWRRIQRRHYTNQDLLEEVTRHFRHISK